MVFIIFFADRGIEINMKRWGLPIMFFTLIVLVVWGYIEDKILKLYSEESKFATERNPIFMQMSKDIEDIKEMMNND